MRRGLAGNFESGTVSDMEYPPRSQLLPRHYPLPVVVEFLVPLHLVRWQRLPTVLPQAFHPSFVPNQGSRKCEVRSVGIEVASSPEAGLAG